MSERARFLQAVLVAETSLDRVTGQLHCIDQEHRFGAMSDLERSTLNRVANLLMHADGLLTDLLSDEEVVP